MCILRLIRFIIHLNYLLYDECYELSGLRCDIECI